MKKLLIMLAVAGAAAVALADVSVNINVTAAGLTDETDTDITLANGFFMTVADVDGDGLDGWTAGGSGDIDGEINFTSGLVSGDDVVLWQGGYFNTSAALSPNEQRDYAGVNGGEAYYMVWSDIGSSATDLGANNVFGFYREDNVNWEVPATGTVGPVVMDSNSVGSYYQTVPEPATALLALIGGGLAYASRRAKRFHNAEEA